MKKELFIHVARQDYWGPGSDRYASRPAEIIAKVNEYVEKVPPEYRNSIKFYFSGYSDDKMNAYATVTVGYSRIETDEEETRRESNERERKQSELRAAEWKAEQLKKELGE